jgi:hypothetical protein
VTIEVVEEGGRGGLVAGGGTDGRWTVDGTGGIGHGGWAGGGKGRRWRDRRQERDSHSQFDSLCNQDLLNLYSTVTVTGIPPPLFKI